MSGPNWRGRRRNSPPVSCVCFWPLSRPRKPAIQSPPDQMGAERLPRHKFAGCSAFAGHEGSNPCRYGAGVANRLPTPVGIIRLVRWENMRRLFTNIDALLDQDEASPLERGTFDDALWLLLSGRITDPSQLDNYPHPVG